MSRYRNLSSGGSRLVVVLALYLALAVTYSIVVPIGRGADEWAHYWYAQFIAQNGRLPANPAEREAAGYKSDWPPLYHLFAAGLTGWIDTDGPPTFKYRADTIRRQLVPAQGPEAILHTRDENFPWQQEILVWHVGRFLSIGFTLGTLIVTYLITLEIFSDRKKLRNTQYPSATLRTGAIRPYTLPFATPATLGLITVAILTFNPRFLFTGMLFNYDSLTLLLSSLFLWLLIRVAKGNHPRWGFWMLGALAGLALVTKYLTAFLPLVIVVVAWRMSRGVGEQGRRGAALRQAQEPEQGSSPSTSSGTGAGALQNDSDAIHHLYPKGTSSLITYHSSLWPKLAQAALAYLLIVSCWFGYLIINFNEIDAYGPVLGTVAPLLRGDGSDRTVEELFARLSGGQAPAPDYIQRQSYSAWQIISELPTTFWGNPIVRPYPLNWFIWAMSLTTLLAAVGLGLFWWGVKGNRFWLNLLLLYCLLPVPFMLVRLFGARDALEAVQGRHILFLSGPAFAILLVLGLWSVAHVMSNIIEVLPRVAGAAPHLARPILMDLLVLLATGALAQLIFMVDTYADPLPVKTTPHASIANPDTPAISLEGGAKLVDYQVTLTPTPYSLLPTPRSLQVTLIWQGGDSFAGQDYQIELQLLDDSQMPVSSWLAYQTQARYPTRAWEPGDTIFDDGYLPLIGLAPGDYDLQLRIIGQTGPTTDWQPLTTYSLQQPVPSSDSNEWRVLQNGRVVRHPKFHERETVQLTTNLQSPISNLQLTGPNGLPRDPTSTAGSVANVIIQPHWPAGEYAINGQPAFRVAESHRAFQIPAEISHPLDVNFDGKIKLLGYHLPSRRVEPGDGLPITLYWQALDWMGEEFVIFDRLLDNQQLAWGGYDRLAQENYSTLLWAPGEVIVDGFAVPVDPNAPNGVYTLSVGWYREVEGQAQSLLILHPETGQPTETTSAQIGPIKVGGPPPNLVVDGASPQVQIETMLGQQIKLLGFDSNKPLKNGPIANNSPLELTFYWQTLDSPDTDYTIFVHIRQSNGEIAAQKDNPPAGGAYPTSLWDSGEIIKDTLTLPLDGLTPGRYEIVAGMYNFVTGDRLPVDGALDGAIKLTSFEIK